MRLAIVAHQTSPTNDSLVAAGEALGIRTVQLTPREALHSPRAADVALARLDVLETCDGIEDGMRELEKLAAAGVLVLNPPAALACMHDRLLTSRALRRAGLPHPHTWLIADDIPAPVPELPVPLKRRYGGGATACRTHAEVEAATRRLYGDDGVLAQELVPPHGPLQRRARSRSSQPTRCTPTWRGSTCCGRRTGGWSPGCRVSSSCPARRPIVP